MVQGDDRGYQIFARVFAADRPPRRQEPQFASHREQSNQGNSDVFSSINTALNCVPVGAKSERRWPILGSRATRIPSLQRARWRSTPLRNNWNGFLFDYLLIHIFLKGCAARTRTQRPRSTLASLTRTNLMVLFLCLT